MASGYYDITNKTLGRGHYGVVKLGRHCLTGEPVAMKIIEKSRLNDDSLNQLGTEIRILFRLSEYEHPNILKLYQTIDTEDKLFLVTEYCGPNACDLHDYLSRKNTRDGLGEKEAQIFFIQICSAISYCHSMGIVHRDLKPENILVTDYRHMYTDSKEGKDMMLDLQYPLLKLIDFGFANQWCSDEMMRTSCGTLAYSAPELLLGEPYDGTKVDVWGLGLMLYILLYGGNPFMQLNDNETLTKILDCSFATPIRTNVDYNAVELLRSLIKRNPDTRLPIDSILRHKWFLGVPKPLELSLKYQDTKSVTNKLDYRPTSPDVGVSATLSDEERKLHELVIQDMFRLTKLLDSKTSIESSLKNARLAHRVFNQNSIQPANHFNRRKVSTGGLVRSLMNTKELLPEKQQQSGDYMNLSQLVIEGQSKVNVADAAAVSTGSAAPDNLGAINSKLNNDDYIYATYQLIRDRILRMRQEELSVRTKDDPNSVRGGNKVKTNASSQEAIPEDDEISGADGSVDAAELQSHGQHHKDRLSARKNDGATTSSGRLQTQRKLLQPQHRMKDKFTSFFRSGSTSPNNSFSLSSELISPHLMGTVQHCCKDQTVTTLSPTSGASDTIYQRHHEAFNDHNNETTSNVSSIGRYIGHNTGRDSYENAIAYALPLARKCSLVKEERVQLDSPGNESNSPVPKFDDAS